MNTITVSVEVAAPLNLVWQYWTLPEHITHWNFASDDWECPTAENTLEVDGRFVYRMSAKDGSVIFDFGGTYTKVEPMRHIAYTMDDGRIATIEFSEHEGVTTVTETFDPETENTEELQRGGWQAILNNFKKYAESQ
jgi:uncharacterized protein YndB with AHSA1/START domain